MLPLMLENICIHHCSDHKTKSEPISDVAYLLDLYNIFFRGVQDGIHSSFLSVFPQQQLCKWWLRLSDLKSALEVPWLKPDLNLGFLSLSPFPLSITSHWFYFPLLYYLVSMKLKDTLYNFNLLCSSCHYFIPFVLP